MANTAMKKANNIIELNFDDHRNDSEGTFNTYMDELKARRSKQAKINASKRRKGSVQPLRTQDEITAVANYLLSKGRYALRNWMIFIFGICTGLRCSDIVCRQWKDVVDEYGNVRNEIYVTERKTGKRRTIAIDDRLYKALCDYVKAYRKKITPDGYMFASQKKDTPYVKVDTVREILSEAIERSINDERRAYNKKIRDEGCVDPNGEIMRPKELVIGGSHSMRKTYAYNQYQTANKHADELGAYGQTPLTYVQTLLNHESSRDTVRYLDLNRELNTQMNLLVSKDIQIPMPPTALLKRSMNLRI